MHALEQKITGFDTWHLALPVTSARDHGIGRVEGTCEVIVLGLTSDGGETGWGEASPWVVFTGSPEASLVALDRYIKPHVLGRKLSERGAILADAAKAVAHCTEAKAALETALLDLTGRVLGVPVYTLLGGTVEPVALPLSVSIANPDFDADRDLLQRLVEDGVKLIKLKTGFREHAFDIARLETIRQDFPSLGVRIDYNQGLAIDEAMRRVKDVATFAPDFIEQPVAASQYAMMRKLREAIDVPLLADESVFGPEDMARAIAEEICDGVSVKIMKSGGLARGQTIARMAAMHGLTAYGGDMFEAGLAHLAGAHLIAATPEITLGCEFYQARYYLKEDILEEPIQYGQGAIHVPNRPGLGHTPDRDKLEHYRV